MTDQGYPPRPPDRTGRPDRVGRHSQADRPDYRDYPEQPGDPGPADYSEPVRRPGYDEQPEQFRPGYDEQPEQFRPGYDGEPEQFGGPDGDEQPEHVGGPGYDRQPGRSSRPDYDGHPGRRDHPARLARPGRSRTAQEPSRTGWQLLDAFDSSADPDVDVPPWAGPGGIEPIRPGRWPQRPPATPVEEPLADPAEPDPADPDAESADAKPLRRRRLPGRTRAAAARRRRSRRRLVTWGGTGVAIVLIVGAVLYLTRSTPARSPFVTSLQKGEYRAVPNACRAVGATTLGQYLPGTQRTIQPFNYPAQSQCTDTVDAKPVFRVLNMMMQAYLPAAYIAFENGSATANATYTYAQQRQLLVRPPKRSPNPPAVITAIAGLGQQALSALQVFHGKLASDRVTVLVRYRNVLITASLEAQESGGFGPVSISELRSGALAVAQQLLAAVQAGPTVS